MVVMGKTNLLQHVYKDEITKEFDYKMWVCVSKNFDVKKIKKFIADICKLLSLEGKEGNSFNSGQSFSTKQTSIFSSYSCLQPIF
ncbi:hypothetical protein KFK09_010122 [Dendrobium nobile]|uniref:NB-ARC domain-containing protein n=1 Tax=Dendrobium nobile TaxID=94219 RepID=A0A8T3BLP1_DENNO|nr:hypothetical protein KFK09_010122 [Dendrobium nobile]